MMCLHFAIHFLFYILQQLVHNRFIVSETQLVRRCRKLKNLTLLKLRGSRTMQEVADAIGIPKSTYACIETGIRKGRPKTMYKIAQFYGVSIEQVFFLENIS